MTTIKKWTASDEQRQEARREHPVSNFEILVFLGRNGLWGARAKSALGSWYTAPVYDLASDAAADAARVLCEAVPGDRFIVDAWRRSQ